ncbi:ATP-binding protein [Bradyrhizobium iriomotense]|uniref:Transcriptional regulator n=1 Tax=Bradyrhizobium iriomotense TaxID=441950 RepID=A0ABQ6AW65_9BRAD|nr:winged helix-turn-helix domain-containing protein [Bradyrhizobium iriomotense]GLR85264.1 transcriptional regulator [Bradyrhizobium iriomotense]
MPPVPATSSVEGFAFGPFRLFPARHLLLKGSKPLRLGGRALDTLTALVEQAGKLVSKDDLEARVWPNARVSESALRVHIAVLRRVLGEDGDNDRFIKTVPGRGYCFVASTSKVSNDQIAIPDERKGNMPTTRVRMLGRADTVTTLARTLPKERFITIVGPGGIGKTTVALAVAEALDFSYDDGEYFVDLAPISDHTLVLNTLASILGVTLRSGDPLESLTRFLTNKRLLLLLDSCEHVVTAVAEIAETICNRTSGVHILATSRERLRVQGEQVHRLSPLDVPPAGKSLTAADALLFSSVQLFIDCVTATLEDFQLRDIDAPRIADICRHLDGIPLAIEIAAGRVDAFGVAGLATQISNRFQLLTQGRRTALARHQTLSRALDWSYELLSEAERAVLRRLSIFVGRFTFDAAAAVGPPGDGEADFAELLANLVSKSLVTADIGRSKVRYRLFDTTRAYAFEKLLESGEHSTQARRHATHLCEVMKHAENDWNALSTSDWLAEYGDHIDDIRSALEWALAESSASELAVDLTVAAVPLWLQLSLMDECKRRVEQALDTLRSHSADQLERKMHLYAALGSTLIYTDLGPRARDAWTSTYDIAEGLANIDYKLRALWGLWVDRINSGEYNESLSLAKRFSSAAEPSIDPLDGLVGDRMLGTTLHLMGEQAEARLYTERMLSGYGPITRAPHMVRFQFDQRSTSTCFQARILWLLGFPDQATRLADRASSDCLATGHLLSICTVLGQGGCLVALLNGDLDKADEFCSALIDRSKHAPGLWYDWALYFRGVILARRGDHVEGLRRLRPLLSVAPEILSMPRYLPLLAEAATCLAACGELPEALATINRALERSTRQQEHWYTPELLRIKAELTLSEGFADAAAELLDNSSEWARRQGANSWELRAAISLLRLRGNQNEAARNNLASILARFTEGFLSGDLRMARNLLGASG